MRFLPVNLTTVLVELADLDQTLALFASLQAAPLKGIDEIVPAARTLMIRLRPGVLKPEDLAADLNRRDLTTRVAPSDTVVEIPVRYDGEDLDEVAHLTGISPDEIVRRHTESEFTVAFCGFAPGFGYLVGGDPLLHVPRRQSPRTRIPAGSVALAGAFSGVYPQASPGGWQIIGTTPLKMWDLSRAPAALLQPGYRVRFFDLSKRTTSPSPQIAVGKPQEAGGLAGQGTRTGFRILAAPMPALFQDLGRNGQAGQGVSGSGALDRGAFNAANRVVGNAPGSPCLEITLGGFSFECLERTVVALTGAPCPITIRNSQGIVHSADVYQPVSLEPGDIVTLSMPATGMRSYLAVRGGFEVQPVLGSASTDTLAVVGPEPVTVGSTLSPGVPDAASSSVSLTESIVQPLPAAGDVVTLDVVMGPRTDWFTPESIRRLSDQSWLVTPQSSRVGIRLAGEMPLEKAVTAELPSEGTATGAIQVPHSGQPVLFLADHPLTGGYPVIANVAEYHLDLAGQIPVNTSIRFRPVTRFGEILPARG